MKHLLLLPVALLIAAVSTAQLYVAPSTTGTPTDSYIYVNDQILYVEQDVNLVANTNDPDTEASIYLRNESQLIQGTTGDNLNKGSGYLSILRDNPDSDAWDYTFYGSPVGDNFSAPMAADGNIDFGIMSIHTPLYTAPNEDYDSPDSPTGALQTNTTTGREGNFNTATNNLEISTRWTYTKEAGHESAWERILDNNVVPAGQGFIMKGVNRDGLPSSHDFVYDFRGRPNNGTFNITVAALNGPHPQSPTDDVYQEVLVGNPYPSALDLNRVFYDMTATDVVPNTTNSEIEEILFWDEDRTINSHLYRDNKGGFGVWTPGLPDPTGTDGGNYVVAPFLNYGDDGIPSGGQTGSGAAYARRFAPVGQGFYFRTRNSQVGDVTNLQVRIRNEHRRYIKESSGDSDFRTSEGSVDKFDGPTTGTFKITPKIRLFTYFDDSHFRDMLLVFSNHTSKYYDWGWDAFHQMDAVHAEAYFPIEMSEKDDTKRSLVIQAVPNGLDQKVPYAIKLDRATEIKIQAVEVLNFRGTPMIWDSLENTYQKIAGNAVATFNLPAGTYEDRFYLVFKEPSITDQPYVLNGQTENRSQVQERITEIKSNVTFFQNNVLGQLEIANPEGYDIAYAHIFDMNGKHVAARTDIGNSRNYTIGTATMADGVYLVKLVTSDNVNIDYKALVTNKR